MHQDWVFLASGGAELKTRWVLLIASCSFLVVAAWLSGCNDSTVHAASVTNERDADYPVYHDGQAALKAASTGEPHAMFWLGIATYRKAQGTHELDYWIAREMIEWDVSEDEKSLVRDLIASDQIAGNYDVAIQWFRRAALRGHRGAATAMGRCHYRRRNNPAELLAAADWWDYAAERGSLLARWSLARTKNATAEASSEHAPMDELIDLYESGLSGVCIDIAIKHYKGWGTDKDIRQWLEWCKKGAKHGEAECIMQLGHASEDGVDSLVDPDIEKADRWWRKAMDVGQGRGAHYLGLSLWNQGKFAEAAECFERGYRLGYEGYSASALGRVYWTGQGRNQDKDYAWTLVNTSIALHDNDWAHRLRSEWACIDCRGVGEITHVVPLNRQGIATGTGAVHAVIEERELCRRCSGIGYQVQ